MPDDSEELAYYRAVEDFFAALRGRPHVLSPRDFQLLREWWRTRVPLAAVTGGITEVFARRRDRGEEDPVVSLSYCRHAVARQSRRLAEMRVGETAGPASPPGEEPSRSVSDLTQELRLAAARVVDTRPTLAAAIGGIADRIEELRDLPPALLEEQLYALEAVLLDSCWRGLPPVEQRSIGEAADAEAVAAGGTEETRTRTRRAVRDRELRALLALPRLELG